MPDHNRPARTFIEWLGFRTSPDWSKCPALGGLIGALLGLAGLVAIGSALVAVPFVIWHTIIQALSPESSGPNLGAGTLIAAILGAPFLIWATIIKQKTVDFQKEGHLTDRISKAVEQIGAEKNFSYVLQNVTYDLNGETRTDYVEDGNKQDLPEGAKNVKFGEWKSYQGTDPNIEVRIGGLLSLERIAQDSTAYDKGRDHVRVMEIICAYIRENAPASGAADSLRKRWQEATQSGGPDYAPASDAQFMERYNIPEYCDLDDYVGTIATRSWAENLPKPREDLALAVQIIGRRTPEQKRIEARWGAYAAPGLDRFYDAPCPKLPEREDDVPLAAEAIDAFKSDLETWLVSLRAFKGYRPDLRNTNLQRHDLSARDLPACDLSGCLLSGARLEGADLERVRLQGADLGAARLDGAMLGEARLAGAILRGAWLEGAILRGARLQGADLGAARLDGADLRQARLAGIRSLNAAKFEGAAMMDLTLANCPISPEQVEATFGDASVTDLPDGMAPPTHWPTRKLYTDFDAQWRKWQADSEECTPPAPPNS